WLAIGTVAAFTVVVFAIPFGDGQMSHPLPLAGRITKFRFVCGIIFYGALVLRQKAIKQGWHGLFLTVFVPATALACLGAAALDSAQKSWTTRPLLLFFGLLTLLTAPFDWASFGLTRALLRRGLELKAWWPYLLAIADACLAVVIIALLALT